MKMEKAGGKSRGYALMRWLNDYNRVSIIDLKHVQEPVVDTYIPGMTGKSRYPGYPGLYQFRILKVGGHGGKVYFLI